MISNCGHDENNRYKGGKAGDQTGGEWALIKWYNRPWKCVLRHPDAKVRKMISDMATAAAKNNKIGYDQSERHTFWQHLKASGYDPAGITVACEADWRGCNRQGCGVSVGNPKAERREHLLLYWKSAGSFKGCGVRGIDRKQISDRRCVSA